MENVMNRRKGKRKMVVIGIIVLIFIVLVIFLKMKYGTYGLHDFNYFFRQSKQEILEKDGEPVNREKLYGNCEDIKFEDIEYTFIGNYMESVRITDPDIRFGILQIGVGSSKKEVMLAYGLKKTLSNEEENEYAVQNGLYSTSFYFDENDRVYKIACGRGV